MKKLVVFIIILLLLFTGISIAKDVYVDGYYRKNGTYVQPYIRKSPDAYKWNNYGKSQNSSQFMNPTVRDKDRDGIPNYLDRDDNNNGILDDYDK
jgi:hypothetical protein